MDSIFPSLGAAITQNLILIVTALITFWIFESQKWRELRNAAILVELQIREIEKNMSYFKAECFDEKFSIDCLKVNTIDPIFEENYWVKHKHLFIQQIGRSDFEELNVFFNNAAKIKEQQRLIKEKQFEFFNGLSHFYYRSVNSYYNDQILQNDQVDIEKVHTDVIRLNKHYVDPTHPRPIIQYITQEYTVAITKATAEYQKIIGTAAFEKIMKMSNKKSWLSLWLWFKLRN